MKICLCSSSSCHCFYCVITFNNNSWPFANFSQTQWNDRGQQYWLKGHRQISYALWHDRIHMKDKFFSSGKSSCLLRSQSVPVNHKTQLHWKSKDEFYCIFKFYHALLCLKFPFFLWISGALSSSIMVIFHSCYLVSAL